MIRQYNKESDLQEKFRRELMSWNITDDITVKKIVKHLVEIVMEHQTEKENKKADKEIEDLGNNGEIIPNYPDDDPLEEDRNYGR